MHSSANYPVSELLPAYREAPALPLKFLLSTGETNDNTREIREFRKVLQNKGYPLKYVEVPRGHNWDN